MTGLNVDTRGRTPCTRSDYSAEGDKAYGCWPLVPPAGKPGVQSRCPGERKQSHNEIDGRHRVKIDEQHNSRISATATAARSLAILPVLLRRSARMGGISMADNMLGTGSFM